MRTTPDRIEKENNSHDLSPESRTKNIINITVDFRYGYFLGMWDQLEARRSSILTEGSRCWPGFGKPQYGHAFALEDTSRLQSGHTIKGISQGL